MPAMMKVRDYARHVFGVMRRLFRKPSPFNLSFVPIALEPGRVAYLLDRKILSMSLTQLDSEYHNVHHPAPGQ